MWSGSGDRVLFGTVIDEESSGNYYLVDIKSGKTTAGIDEHFDRCQGLAVDLDSRRLSNARGGSGACEPIFSVLSHNPTEPLAEVIEARVANPPIPHRVTSILRAEHQHLRARTWPNRTRNGHGPNRRVSATIDGARAQFLLDTSPDLEAANRTRVFQSSNRGRDVCQILPVVGTALPLFSCSRKFR